MFEQYAHEHGYQFDGPDVPLGSAGKRPDYLVHTRRQDVAVEVESFESPVPYPSTDAGGSTADTGVTRIRDKIKLASRQLKGIDGMPVVAVIANPRNIGLPLDPPACH
jgi:hypothetical protein